MTWRVVTASEIGTSHIASGGQCEDSGWAQVDSGPDGLPVFSLFVSDGAGSAALGAKGAELAIEAAAAFIAERLTHPAFALDDEFAVECIKSIRQKLLSFAKAENRGARDLACTFLGLVSSMSTTLVMQIGDGGIALDVGNGLEIPIVPMSGEYANMTHFVTDEDAISVLATKTYPAPVTRAAAFSDGLQRLAMDMVTNTAHDPFFAPFFKTLLNAFPEQDDQLHSALVRFLRSPAVNDRTDDDKTLALAVAVS